MKTYQQLLQQWSTLAPNECRATENLYAFMVKYNNTLRLVCSDNLDKHTLDFVLVTIINHCLCRNSRIEFASVVSGEVVATISGGLRSQPYSHIAIAALDAYIQLLEF
ncbi:hypothetical protein PCC6912_40260 [Chlorogloeopsis fritschii PCC 6912]|uniref:Uncharacterized protein n=1 Tax=Chlorogloeopsis fritschii PCC 6912 TaxID=211165 RepID=A0A3S0XUF0_CHLFR|nr:hypothetical protein [Chlorogloeopsis fritschii]RUR77067.1 hypothetical protein PCC6912_40260 [Chlorogloeopsis fritschii PCC 6912]